eukprot:scaffold16811_cov73-Cyclotella_meneghiniana.AAC.1
METAAIYPLELGWYKTNHYKTWLVKKLGMMLLIGYILSLDRYIRRYYEEERSRRKVLNR